MQENSSSKAAELLAQPRAQAVIALVNAPQYQPTKPRVLAERLDIPEDERREFRRLIKKLVKLGVFNWGAKHLVHPGPAIANPTGQHSSGKQTAATSGKEKQKQPASDKHSASGDGQRSPREGITGVFQRKAGGFGFVRPSTVLTRGDRTQDIYIPADKALDAATGDTVLVRLSKRPARGKNNVSGDIVEVLERETHQFVGTYFERAGGAFVQVDGALFEQPIYVGDPSAKMARPDDKVVFEMVRFPSHTHDGEGVISEVLGARGEPGVDTLCIIREHNLPTEFPEDVLEAARLVAEQFTEEVTDDRTDFTPQTVITIDPVDARDFDDAISLERLDNGHWLLSVHIADVSHFVQPKSALDREAYERATSVYLPDRVLPMLPEIISNSLASLQPGRVRYTKTAVIEFTPDGAPVGVELHRGAICSDRRFAYEEVDDFLANPGIWKKKLEPAVFNLLGRMYELAMILRRRRFRRGSLELSMREVKVDLDTDGRVSGAHPVQQTESHQIIEEFMLAANEAVARRLAEAELPFLRRVHSNPDPRKLELLTEFVTELGFSVENLENRFELQELLAQVVDHPAEYAVNYAVLRSLQRAVYSPEDEGHYALASDCYCHFTSPIRRYPDLTIHRLIDDLLSGKTPTADFADLTVHGIHCSERERRAEAAERELTKLKLLGYLSDKVGLQLEGVITGVEQFGLFVQGTDLPAEGLLHITSLQDDYYSFDRGTHSLVGRREGNAFRLGDILQVEVAVVNLDRRELDFRLVGRKPRATSRNQPVRGTGAATPRRKESPSERDGRPAARDGQSGRGRDGKPSGGQQRSAGKRTADSSKTKTNKSSKPKKPSRKPTGKKKSAGKKPGKKPGKRRGR